MTTVVISQPMYLPWAGFLSLMTQADILIWLDDAQFSRGSFTNRVQIATATGSKWLSIPLAGKGSGLPIRDLQADRADWSLSHRELVRQALRGTPHLADALSITDAVAKHETLCDALIASAERCLLACTDNLPGRMRASTMNVPGSGSRRVLDLVHAVGGTRYLTGHGAANYLDHYAFEAEGVVVEYMAYDLLPWPQRHGDFTPYVTSLDLIANVALSDRRNHLATKTVPWRQFLADRSVAVTG